MKANTKKAAAKAAVKPAVKSAKGTLARTLYGGWNRKRTALLTYDINGEWKSKVAATKAVKLIESGELAPISSVYENRKAADPKEIAGRAIQLQDEKAAKKQSNADARQKADADRKAKEKERLAKLAEKKAAKQSSKKAAVK